MALLGDLAKTDNSYKVDFTNVYFKIDGAIIDTLKEVIRVSVRGYADEYARHNKGIGIWKKVYKIPLSEISSATCTKENILTELYKALKNEDELKNVNDSLEAYSGSIDIEDEKKDDTEKEPEELLNEI